MTPLVSPAYTQSMWRSAFIPLSRGDHLLVTTASYRALTKVLSEQGPYDSIVLTSVPNASSEYH